MNKKIAFIFGTRPEAIKMLPIIKSFQQSDQKIDPIIIFTAQHRELATQVLDIFEVKPNYDLNTMKEDQSIDSVISYCLGELTKILRHEKPDIVLVQGDTATTFVGALSAFLNKIAIGHVEAGLRSYDKYQPFPEEVFRKSVTSMADLNFAPTLNAKKNLISEGISERKVFVTGNTGIDTLFEVLRHNHGFDEKMEKIISSRKKLILVTAHRRENFGEPIKHICYALNKLAELHEEINILFSVHPNPNVRKIVGNLIDPERNVYLASPLNYIGFVHIMKKSHIILTDSGGIQEEAPSLGKPVLVLRNRTERPEGIEAGTAKLIGTNTKAIVSETSKLLKDKNYYNSKAKIKNPYGDGNASSRINEIILNFLK